MNNNFSFKKIDEMTSREMFAVARLRNETFVTEQKITLPDLDDQDLTAVQVFLLNEKQTDALATCRLFVEKDKWMLGRVAVSKKSRGQSLGKKMLLAVHNYLKEQNASALYCHAQMHVKPFYEKLGYQTCGEPFDEGGVEHIMMKKSLS